MAVQADFEPEPNSAKAVRRLVKEALPEVPRRDDIILAASELATNAIRHADTDFTVELVLDGEFVRLEVSDGLSLIIPALEELSDSKRGLRIIEAVSERWGIDVSETGKTIWVEFTNMA